MRALFLFKICLGKLIVTPQKVLQCKLSHDKESLHGDALLAVVELVEIINAHVQHLPCFASSVCNNSTCNMRSAPACSNPRPGKDDWGSSQHIATGL